MSEPLQLRRAFPLHLQQDPDALEGLFFVGRFPLFQDCFQFFDCIPDHYLCCRTGFAKTKKVAKTLVNLRFKRFRDMRAFSIQRGGMLACSLRKPRTAEPELRVK